MMPWSTAPQTEIASAGDDELRLDVAEKVVLVEDFLGNDEVRPRIDGRAGAASDRKGQEERASAAPDRRGTGHLYDDKPLPSSVATFMRV